MIFSLYMIKRREEREAEVDQMIGGAPGIGLEIGREVIGIERSQGQDLVRNARRATKDLAQETGTDPDPDPGTDTVTRVGARKTGTTLRS